MLPRVLSSQPGTKNRQVLLGRGHQPAVFRIDHVVFFEPALAKQPVHEFMRKQRFAPGVHFLPEIQHGKLYAPHRFFLGNAGVGHTVHVPGEQFLFHLRCQVAVARHAFVIIVRDEVENILFKICARAGDGVHFVLSNHLGKGKPEFRRAHGSCERHEHAATAVEQGLISPGSVHEGRAVEMPVMMRNEICDGMMAHDTSHWWNN